MSTAQHTPGPWKTEIWDYSHASPSRRELNVQNASRLIATLQCDFVGDNEYVIPRAEAEANARLIAAAPELLEALKALVEVGRTVLSPVHNSGAVADRTDHEILVAAVAAIAKATGGAL